MSNFVKALGIASVASVLALAAPAAAQVQGKVATVSPTAVIFGSQARISAYQAIPTTYKPQIDFRNARQQRRQELLATADKNNDNEVDEAELEAIKGTATETELTQVTQEINATLAQLERARLFAVEQIMLQYNAALNEVISQQQIAIVLDPSVVIHPVEGIDISDDVITALNAKVPSVGVVPPETWQPNRQSVQMYQQIQQIGATLNAIQQQQAAAAAQQQGTTPPATQAPEGR